MSRHASVLQDGSILSYLDQQLFKLEKILLLLGGLAAFSLMLLAVINVSGRHFVNHPLPGYVDWIEQAMPVIAFMGIAYTQRVGGHIRMDVVVSQLRGRWLWGFEFFATLLTLILMLGMVYGTYFHFQRSFDFTAPLWSHDSSMDISLPLWPAKLIPPMIFSILVLRLGLQLWGYGKVFIKHDGSPVAVPLIEDVAIQAKREANDVSNRSV